MTGRTPRNAANPRARTDRADLKRARRSLDDSLVAPLDQFELSERNVRKEYGDAEIVEMADSIRRYGVLQNLIAEPLDNGRLGVVAGGRRLRALQLLAEDGEILPVHPVVYRLAEPDQAREVSLEENVQKVALNPVDEIDAFARIVADHAGQADPLAYCATRTGKSRRYVEQQLRLSDLPGAILDALRAGRIDLAAARAYASTADADAQLAVFAAEERRTFGRRHDPREVTATLRGRSYPADVPQARFVGLDAYLAVGGRVAADLFFGEEVGADRLLDPAMLDRLARTKAEAALPAATARDGVSAGVLTLGFNAAPAWPKPPATHVIRTGALPDTLAAEERAAAIGVYGLADDGSGLRAVGVMTAIALPAPARQSASPPPVATPAAAREATAPSRGEATQPPAVARPAPAPASAPLRVDRGGRPGLLLRKCAAILAAQRAVATLATHGEHDAPRILLPDPAQRFDVFHEPVEEERDGTILVTVQVRVVAAEIDAMVGAAEAMLAEVTR